MPSRSASRTERIALLEELADLEYLSAERRLRAFCKGAWGILEPTTPLVWGWHHDLLCEHLEAVRLGQILRLVVNMPPRELKSTITTIAFPTWIWGPMKQPGERMLFGSFAEDLARKHSMHRRTLIESDWYQARWGKVFQLKDDLNTKTDFANDKMGQQKAAGMLGSVTGSGGNYIFYDDPHNPKKVHSDQERQNTLEAMDLVWSSRLNDRNTGRIVCVMQRTHEMDATKHLVDKGGYTHLILPGIEESNRTLYFPVSKKTIERKEGDLLNPTRLKLNDPAFRSQIEKEYGGDLGFASQIQQRPVPKGGALFRTHMIEYVDELPTEWDWCFITADTAYTDKQTSDFTCFSSWGMSGGDLYLRGVLHKQMKAEEVEAPAGDFIMQYTKYGFRGAYIEPKGHGIYLNQAFAKKGILIPDEKEIKEFFKDRRLSKVERANNAVPYLANRVVKFWNKIPEVEGLKSQVITFPRALKDDFTDTFIDAVKRAFAHPLTIFDVL